MQFSFIRLLQPKQSCVKLKIKAYSTVAMQLLVLIFFVSITLAQEDGKSESQLNSSSLTNEERYRAAGIIFPSLDEIRESFKRFQEHLSSFRRNGGGFGTSGPRQPQNLSSSINSNSNSNLNSNGNNYFRNSNSNFFGSGSSHGDDSESIYPPGFRKPSNFYKTSPTSTSADLQHHTTTTIYIICVCLIIMVVGSVLFICVNKCQETGVANPNASPNINSRRSRSNNLSSESSSNRNSRISISTISIALPSSEGSASGSSSIRNSSSNIPGVNIDFHDKLSYDMPPSYASLFPTGK